MNPSLLHKHSKATQSSVLINTPELTNDSVPKNQKSNNITSSLPYTSNIKDDLKYDYYLNELSNMTVYNQEKLNKDIVTYIEKTFNTKFKFKIDEFIKKWEIDEPFDSFFDKKNDSTKLYILLEKWVNTNKFGNLTGKTHDLYPYFQTSLSIAALDENFVKVINYKSMDETIEVYTNYDKTDFKNEILYDIISISKYSDDLNDMKIMIKRELLSKKYADDTSIFISALHQSADLVSLTFLLMHTDIHQLLTTYFPLLNIDNKQHDMLVRYKHRLCMGTLANREGRLSNIDYKHIPTNWNQIVIDQFKLIDEVKENIKNYGKKSKEFRQIVEKFEKSKSVFLKLNLMEFSPFFSYALTDQLVIYSYYTFCSVGFDITLVVDILLKLITPNNILMGESGTSDTEQAALCLKYTILQKYNLTK